MHYLDINFLDWSSYDVGEGFYTRNDSLHPLVFMKVYRQDITYDMICIISIPMLCPFNFMVISLK